MDDLGVNVGLKIGSYDIIDGAKVTVILSCEVTHDDTFGVEILSSTMSEYNVELFRLTTSITYNNASMMVFYNCHIIIAESVAHYVLGHRFFI